jgi:hypothetical protein
MVNIRQDDVTWYYKNDINFIRNQSIGFIEISEKNKDDETFTADIELFSHK